MSIRDERRLPAASAISPISTTWRGCINTGAAGSACDFSSVRPFFFQIIAHVLVITSAITVKGEDVELEEGHSGLI